MHSPLPLSVLIPTCAISNALWEAIDSVLAADQIHPVGEILVIPNAGLDNQKIASEIAERYLNSKAKCIVREQAERIPVFSNWNNCVEFARYDLVHIFHDDDILINHFYLQLARLVNRWPGAALYYQAVISFGDRQNIFCPALTEGVWKNAKLEIAQGNCLACPGIVFRKSFHRKFNEKLAFTADWEAWAMLASRGEVVVSPFAAALYRIHGNSITEKLRKARKIAEETLEMSKNLCKTLYPELSGITRIRMSNRARCAAAVDHASCGKLFRAFSTLVLVGITGYPIRAVVGNAKVICRIALKRFRW